MIRLIALLALACPAWSEPVAISASVNKNAVALDDQVVLTVTVSGTRTDLPEPELPAIPNFNIHSAGRSQNISFVNGAVSSSIEYSYVLVPRFPGKAVIGPIAASAGGSRVQTAPIEISVLRPSSQPPAAVPQAARRRPSGPAARAGDGNDLFIAASVSKTQPYVNEEVLLTVNFYAGVPLLGNAEWNPPDIQGFLSEDLPPGQPKQVTRNGRTYALYEVQMALYPAQAGQLTIGPGTIRCQVQADMNLDPFSPDFFQRFFSSGIATQSRVMRSNAISLTALPLPAEGKPASFSGAVGRYRIKAEVDRKEAAVGDAINLTITLEGNGNLKALGDLQLPEMPNFRVYDVVGSLNLQKDSSGVRGSKIYKTVLVPKVSGKLRVSAIPFSYFDPQRKQYVQLETAPIEISAAPGSAAAGPKPYVALGGDKTITQLNEDIRYLKHSMQPNRGSRLAFALGRTSWLHFIPLAIFLSCLGFSMYRDILLKDPAGMRFKRALAKAQSRVRQAEARDSSEPQGKAAALADALTSFVADKLDCPASGLTLRHAQKLIGEKFKNMPEGHLERMRMIWEELELLRFAPADSGTESKESQHLCEAVLELVRALDEVMKPC